MKYSVAEESLIACIERIEKSELQYQAYKGYEWDTELINEFKITTNDVLCVLDYRIGLVSSELGVSNTTVEQWAKGEIYPCFTLLKPILDSYQKVLREKYNNLIRRILDAKQKLEDSDLFCNLTREFITVTGLSHETVACDLVVSRSTITRWFNKINAPHEKMRKLIYNYYIDLLIAEGCMSYWESEDVQASKTGKK
jgi:transcriptional regulator with XRE-family HTH domain